MAAVGLGQLRLTYRGRLQHRIELVQRGPALGSFVVVGEQAALFTGPPATILENCRADSLLGSDCRHRLSIRAAPLGQDRLLPFLKELFHVLAPIRLSIGSGCACEDTFPLWRSPTAGAASPRTGQLSCHVGPITVWKTVKSRKRSG